MTDHDRVEELARKLYAAYLGDCEGDPFEEFEEEWLRTARSALDHLKVDEVLARAQSIQNHCSVAPPCCRECAGKIVDILTKKEEPSA